ncbi:hypothetical protein [Phenylobacterium sp.]|uniref:hypothetical protein n=1 Tax=Phenylobacterium sp. TaxID=1871053 RepID=UPI0025DB3A30|nr:hypothetical protein [Phenylobacterium sp.]
MADDIPFAAPPPAQTDGARRPRRRWARGVDRPAYLQPGDLDRMMVMFVALMSEVSALRARVDTHEALLDGGTSPSTAAVEAYVPDDARGVARDAQRQAMLSRVLRAITEEREAALDGRKPEIAHVDHAG